MKKSLLLFLLSLSFISNSLIAQDQIVYSQFFMNPYLINSAYVGSTGFSTFSGSFRQQWKGIDGAPTRGYVSFHTPLENNLSIGGLAFNDNDAYINTSGVKASAGYLMQLDRKQFLRFGFSVGGGYTGYDVEPNNDKVLASLSSSAFLLADLGISYYYNNWNLGLSIPNLIGREVVTTESVAPIQIAPHENLTLNANYRHFINRDLSIEPHIIYRFSYVNMPQFEIATIVHIGHAVWAGVNYRQEAGVAALLGFKIKEEWAIGFAYEYGSTELDGFSSGSMELSLGYNMGKKKKNQKQALSFINNFKKTKAQQQKEAARRQRLAQQRKKAAEERAKQEAVAKVDKTQTNTETETETNIDDTETKTDVTESVADNNEDNQPNQDDIAHEVIDHSIPIKVRTTQTGQWELGATYIQTRIDSSKISLVKWHDALTEAPKDIELPPNTVRRGTKNALELPAGHHVIAGEFEDYETAEDYSDKI